MCDLCARPAGSADAPRHAPAGTGLSRRSFLVGTAAAAAALAVARPRPAAAALATVAFGAATVHPRETWGGSRPPTGVMADEPKVSFLVVHHTAEPGNDYTADQVPSLLQGIYDFHTKPEADGGKGWPDVAYSFFVDKFGGIWEGRTGSMASAVVNDETGGNQGSARFCCFLGDLSSAPPTAAAIEAMAKLLGTLASKHSISLAAGAKATFVSRGSNKIPSGETATVRTLSGHRDVGQTACPGDAGYAVVGGELRTKSEAVRASLSAAATTTTTKRSTATSALPYRPGTVPSGTSASIAPLPVLPSVNPLPDGLTTTTIPDTTTTVGDVGSVGRVTVRDDSGRGGKGTNPLVWAGAGALAVLVVAGGVWDVRRRLLARTADRGWKRPGQEAEEAIGTLPSDEPLPSSVGDWSDLRDGDAAPGQTASTAPDLPAWEAPDDEAMDRWLEAEPPSSGR